MKFKKPENPDLNPVEWIKVSVQENATIYHEVTIGVPRGLTDDEVMDFLHEDRNLDKLYKEENRTIEWLDLVDFNWSREGKNE